MIGEYLTPEQRFELITDILADAAVRAVCQDALSDQEAIWERNP